MQIAESTLSFVKQFEKLFLTPTQKPNNPPGVITIGLNMKAYPNGTQVTLGDKPISEEQADAYLRERLEKSFEYLRPWIPDNLNQNQIDALMSLMYDIGVDNYSRKTFLRGSIAGGEPEEQVRAAWAKIYKDPERRQVEADLFFS